MSLGLAVSTAPRVLRTDADIHECDFANLTRLVDSSAGLARAIFTSPYDQFPVTRLVVEPLLKLVEPAVMLPPLPLSGTYLLRRVCFLGVTLPTDWAFDIAVLLHAIRREMRIDNVDIGVLADRPRDMSHYVPMATEIMRFMLAR
jgi:glucosyl-3-phosphoglycerate synthase